jgi:hypothetical protein
MSISNFDDVITFRIYEQFIKEIDILTKENINNIKTQKFVSIDLIRKFYNTAEICKFHSRKQL